MFFAQGARAKASLLACSASRAQGLGRAQARARVCCAAKGRRRGSSVSPASGALPRCDVVAFWFELCSWILGKLFRNETLSKRTYVLLLQVQFDQDPGVVFDLDGCIWSPEMYELSWDRGGSPFRYDEKGVMRDRSASRRLRVESGASGMFTGRPNENQPVACAKYYTYMIKYVYENT